MLWPALLLSCGSPGYTELPVAAGPGGLDVHELRLANGLRALVIPDASSPTVAWQTWVAVGSADDPPGRSGLAHLFEHLGFRATDAWSAGGWDDAMAPAGAVGTDAWTWLDETVFVQSVPKEAVPLLAHMDAVRLTRLAVDQSALDGERAIVLDERKTRIEGDPSAVMREALWRLAVDGDAYGRPSGGETADLLAVDVPATQAFYREHYAPDRVTLAIVGDVDVDAIGALLVAEYGGLAPIGPPAPAAPDPGFHAGDSDVTLASPTDRVAVGFELPAASDADLPALEVLDALLTGGQESALKRGLERTGLAIGVDSRLVAMRRASVWELQAQARPGVSASAVEAALWADVASLRTDGPTPDALARAKAQLATVAWGQLEDGAGKAAFLGWWDRAAGDWRRGTARIAAFDAVSIEDVRREAERLQPERAAVILGHGTGAVEDIAAPPAPEAVPTPPIAARAAGEPVGGAPAEYPSHGGTVHLEPDAHTPLLAFRLAFPVGSGADDVPGEANLAARALLRGTTTRDRAAFEAAVEGLGASVDVDCDADDTVLRARVLADRWPALIALLTDAIAHPVFAPAEVDALRGEMVNRMVRRLDDDRALALRVFEAVYWGRDHPYAHSPIGTPSGLGRLTPEDLGRFHAKWHRSGGAVVSLSGAYDAQAPGELEELLAAIEGDPPPRPELPAPVASPGRRVILVDKPTAQATVLVGQRGPDASSADWPAFTVADLAFGGTFASPLVREIRVTRGWSYRVASGSTLHPHGPGTWGVALAPPVDHAVDASDRVLALIDGVRRGLQAVDTDRVRESAIHSAPFLTDTASKRAAVAVRRLLGGPDDPAVRAALEGVNQAEADAAIAGVVDPEHAVIVIVGPADAIRTDAARLGGELATVAYDHVW
jgi:zinc protease